MDIHGLDSNSSRTGKAVPHDLSRAGKQSGGESLKLGIHLHGAVFVDPAAGLDINLFPGSESHLENISVSVDPHDAFTVRCGEMINEEPSPTQQHIGNAFHPRECVLDAAGSGKKLVLSHMGPHISSHGSLHRDHMLVPLLLNRAEAMARRSAQDDDQNSALQLGVLLGVLALEGRDKPTLVAPPALASFGTWLEQLIAESLGKQGKGVIPISGETPGPPDVYGNDRVFIHLRSASAPDAAADAQVERLERAGQPIVRIVWPASG